MPQETEYAYSNLGIDLAGYILGRVSGKGFVPYVDALLKDEIGMQNTTLDMEKIEANPNRAVGHDSRLYKVPVEIPMIPAGGVYASANDMIRFVRYHMRNQESLAEMYRIPFPKPGQTEGYALGVEKWVRNGNQFLTHGGGGFGFLSAMIWYPKLKIGVVVLTNSGDTPTDFISPYALGTALLDGTINDPRSVYYALDMRGETPAYSNVPLIKFTFGLDFSFYISRCRPHARWRCWAEPHARQFF
ncbi:MAG TPA: serine hydrolase domain-containing protein [Anaerovoracaceae bacterium]|nr:serine hydrolase domain-containing protein [Anaerovoracaceae bacterium]